MELESVIWAYIQIFENLVWCGKAAISMNPFIENLKKLHEIISISCLYNQKQLAAIDFMKKYGFSLLEK